MSMISLIATNTRHSPQPVIVAEWPHVINKKCCLTGRILKKTQEVGRWARGVPETALVSLFLSTYLPRALSKRVRHLNG